MAGNIKSVSFSEGVATTAPTDLILDATGFLSYANDAAYVTAKGSAAANGDAYYNTTDNTVHQYAAGAWNSLALGTGGTLANPIVTNYVEFTEASVPGTPASGKTRVYVKADGLAYSKDDAGTETAFGGGGTTYAYVGTNPETGGTTPFLLTTSHKRTQVINPAGAIAVRMPTTGVLVGDTWRIENRSTQVVDIATYDGGQAIETVRNGFCILVALQAAPTLAAHWKVMDIYESYEPSGLTIYSSGVAFGSKTINVHRIVRHNKQVTWTFKFTLTASTTGDLGIDAPHAAAFAVMSGTGYAVNGGSAEEYLCSMNFEASVSRPLVRTARSGVNTLGYFRNAYAGAYGDSGTIVSMCVTYEI